MPKMRIRTTTTATTMRRVRFRKTCGAWKALWVSGGKGRMLSINWRGKVQSGKGSSLGNLPRRSRSALCFTSACSRRRMLKKTGSMHKRRRLRMPTRSKRSSSRSTKVECRWERRCLHAIRSNLKRDPPGLLQARLPFISLLSFPTSISAIANTSASQKMGILREPVIYGTELLFDASCFEIWFLADLRCSALVFLLP